MRTFAAISAVLAVFSAASVPVLPDKWQSIVLQQLFVNQGGGVNTPAGLLCPTDAPDCRIQAEFIAARQFYDSVNNRTALKNPDNSGIVTWYNVSKEFQVSANGTCQAYCPLSEQDDEFIPVQLDANSVDEGSVTYMGKTVEYWRGTELFTVDNWYLQGNTPVGWVQDVNFLGQVNITSNQTFLQFTSGAADSDFLVRGWEKCPESDQCSGGSSSSSSPFPGSDDGGSTSSQPSKRAAVGVLSRTLTALRANMFFPSIDIPAELDW
jgi:hypothetical protein